MNDTDKMIIEEIRIMRKESNDNFVLLHQKVEVIKDDHQEQITANSKDIVSFKAKWGILGLAFIAIGNFIKPVVELFKD